MMMKKILTLAVLATLAVSLAAIANDSPKAKSGGEKVVSGSIARLDTANKSLTVTDSKGASWTILWNDSTRILGGELKEGQPVKLGYVEAQDKMWATWIRAGEAGK